MSWLRDEYSQSESDIRHDAKLCLSFLYTPRIRETNMMYF